MGLFSNLLETYEKCSSAVGIVQTDTDGNSDEKKTFLPEFHTTFKSHICVTIDDKGQLIDANRDEQEMTIIIPCSEDSEGRSGRANFPNPLCDKLEYISSLDKNKLNKYLTQLEDWKNQSKYSSQQKLSAIYTYLNNNRIIDDLFNKSIFKEKSEYEKDANENRRFVTKKNQSGNLEIVVKNLGVRFVVEMLGDLTSNVWEDKSLRTAWIEYLLSTKPRPKTCLFDYISSANVDAIADKHPKKINLKESGAKLISCNDTSGLTFRGRFDTQDDALIIDCVQSQKVHQTLKWLISNYGSHTDSQVIAIWAVDKNTEEPIKPFDNSFDLFDDMETVQMDSEKLQNAEIEIDANYAQKVASTLRGYGSPDKIKQHSKKIIIAIFDAATTGRMGVTFYQEFPENEYLENIAKWHEESTWHLTSFVKVTNTKGKEETKPIAYIGCPSFNDILVAVYGKPRSGNDTGYMTLKKKMQKQLLECMFGNIAFPKSLVDAAAVRVSHPMSFTDDKGSFKELHWRYSLEIACSLTKKHIKQQRKEDISMELEESRPDRDYLFGRLLSVADRLEATALYKAGVEDRATNAVKLMSAFAVKPYSTWGVLWKQLIPYKNQLCGAGYYQSIIDGIMALFKDGEFEDNKPLSSLYLLGYSAQNRALFNNNKPKEKTNNDNITE
jgi:CRISPR-associated protein Csd1